MFSVGGSGINRRSRATGINSASQSQQRVATNTITVMTSACTAQTNNSCSTLSSRGSELFPKTLSHAIVLKNALMEIKSGQKLNI